MWLLFLLFLGESSGMLLVRHKQLLCVYTDTFGFGKQVNCVEAWMCRVSGPAGQFSSAPAHYVLVAFPPYLGVFLARYFCVCVCAHGLGLRIILVLFVYWLGHDVPHYRADQNSEVNSLLNSRILSSPEIRSMKKEDAGLTRRPSQQLQVLADAK